MLHQFNTNQQEKFEETVNKAVNLRTDNTMVKIKWTKHYTDIYGSSNTNPKLPKSAIEIKHSNVVY